MEFPAYSIVPEPKLSFEAFSQGLDIHPLRGLKSFSPYSAKINPINSIRVAAIYPAGTHHILENLVKELHGHHVPKERKNYLEDFSGVESVFKRRARDCPKCGRAACGWSTR